MRRVFIDTNILIDFVENRPGADAAEKVLENGANKVISLFASPLTFANMAYILENASIRKNYIRCLTLWKNK